MPAVQACPEGVQGLHALRTGVHGQHACPAGPHAKPAVLTPFVGVRTACGMRGRACGGLHAWLGRRAAPARLFLGVRTPFGRAVIKPPEITAKLTVKTRIAQVYQMIDPSALLIALRIPMNPAKTVRILLIMTNSLMINLISVRRLQNQLVLNQSRSQKFGTIAQMLSLIWRRLPNLQNKTMMMVVIFLSNPKTSLAASSQLQFPIHTSNLSTTIVHLRTHLLCPSTLTTQLNCLVKPILDPFNSPMRKIVLQAPLVSHPILLNTWINHLLLLRLHQYLLHRSIFLFFLFHQLLFIILTHDQQLPIIITHIQKLLTIHIPFLVHHPKM
ncbi:hypothetical protein PCANC_24744 [Puccinia coronata f. sp. avenae]|uniref:Uncharacterized protein n=1 Tax=Puccinia coronata f. sp. avenae TaxID=200324 RepID=A0A2N5TWX0_9BASI|nr:hypothetical protein PCASD_25988 [Puccinia coronata f. sp. avenae]PLW29972.1 hypothetical protein PCANC_24744 [Puccinia coronata f. sp. avenae]PLW35840.1 hypothetical protein PCASD_14433 [Puccinia coronata f. sp. avenae]